MNTPASNSRRRFLGQASCASITATPVLSTLLNLQMTNSVVGAPSDPNDYKALVCFFFAGGNDSFNMLAPKGASEHAEYATTRSNQALPQSSILALNGTHNGKTLGVHPGMPEVQSLYNSGKLAFVSNVGTLVENVTLERFNNGLAKLPAGLFSHSDQIMHWQTSVPDAPSSTGWGGRVADILSSCNTNTQISMNISLAGTNTFQSGAGTVSYEIEPTGNGSIALMPYAEGEDPTLAALGQTAINSMMDAQYSNLFQQTFAEKNRSALDASTAFSSAIAAQTVNTVFSANRISQSFQMIAKTIAARNTLGMKRQTFFVLFGGFDHHDELLNNHAAMLPVISKAMSEFDTAMTELNLQNNVTTFTASDFARTLTSNGKGTDHAWGSNQMVMGGAVQGGQIYGTYPSLALGSDLDTGRGRLIPTMSTDEYFAEIARWFGVSNVDLTSVFPNLTRFYTPGAVPPVGFMSS
ncbi:MAG: DUF1501 domain-containing protein [Verrucomicrobiota bacterium]